MKLLKKNLERNSSGSVQLVLEDSEDVWVMYNVILPGDQISCKSFRKIATGTGDTIRKLVYLDLKVTKCNLDSPHSGLLRISGQIQNQVEGVQSNAFHAFDLEYNRSFKLYKDHWDTLAMENIEKACDPESKAEVGAVVMEEGIAHICLITETMTILRQKVEINIPRKKRGDSSGHDKSIRHFYEIVLQTMKRNLPLNNLKAIILASPGFVAREYCDYIFERAAAESDKDMLRCKPKFLVVNSSTGYLQGLADIMKDPGVLKQLQDTKYASHTALLDKFYKTLNDNETRAWYGPKHVAKAVELGAVSNLLIIDSLFRSEDVQTRRNYIAMVESVRDTGGEVAIFSSLHEAGKQLEAITGIACLLSYPLPELEDIESSDDDSDSD